MHPSCLPACPRPSSWQRRLNFTVSLERLTGVVSSLSRPNLVHNNYAPTNVVWPVASRSDTSFCDCGLDGMVNQYRWE